MKQEAAHFGTGVAALTGAPEGPVGVFVDGENLQSWAAGAIAQVAMGAPEARICRVYGHHDHLHDWHGVEGFEVIHTGVPGSGAGETVKNAADVRITVDVMEFALAGLGQTVILCSSDRDFTPLVWTLRRYGRVVIGVGEAKASKSFRAVCHRFVEVSAPEKAGARGAGATAPGPVTCGIEEKILHAVERLGGRGKGCPIAALNAELRRTDGFNISCLPDPADRQWRKYLSNRPETYRLDPRGPDARVRIVPAGARKD